MDLLAIAGTWLSIFLTLAILSFLYDDNPIYKFAEHLFMGLGIGIGTIEVYYGVFEPKLLLPLYEDHRLLSLCPLLLLVLLFTKLTRNHQHWARLPIAFIVAAFAGVKLTGEANGRLLAQVKATMPDLREVWAANLDKGRQMLVEGVPQAFEGSSWSNHYGDVVTRERVLPTCNDKELFNWAAGTRFEGLWDASVSDTWVQGLWCWSNGGAGIISSVILVLGLCACLLHFYFSTPHNKPMRVVSRIGILTLMLSFGASFGFTVMGRISLAIGRAEALLGLDKADSLVPIPFLKDSLGDALQMQRMTAIRITTIITLIAVILVIRWLKLRADKPDPDTTTT